MNSNGCSCEYSSQPAGRPPDGVAALTADLDALDAEDLTGLPVGVRVERLLALRRLLDRLEGCWLKELAAVDARGAAGADQGTPAPSTASWLRGRLRLGAGAAASAVRTARALVRGPLSGTAQALCAGESSPAHASALVQGTSDLPDQVAAEAEPILVAAARRLDPPRRRRAVTHLRDVADPQGPTSLAERRHGRRGLWLAPTLGRAWSPSRGSWTPRPATPSWRPWSPWPAPTTATTPAAVTSAAPMPWSSWPAAPSRAAGCPRPAGSGPS
jgi:Domain of unknown function (DUF222)